MKRLGLIIALGAAALSTAGCRRGTVSSKPPVHLIGDMDWQPRYHPEGESVFANFKDGRSMRPLVEGTVARGTLHDGPVFTGVEPGTETGDPKMPGTYLRRGPFAVDKKLIARGQERFNIFCAPCHDRTGSGHGVVIQRGFFPPVDLSSEHTRGLADGEIFNIISHGVRNMPSYGYQVPAEDRWAIISWVRVLQKSGHATLDDVPAADRNKLDSEGGSK